MKEKCRCDNPSKQLKITYLTEGNYYIILHNKMLRCIIAGSIKYLFEVCIHTAYYLLHVSDNYRCNVNMFS
jgi:hypothetical protein